MNNWNSDSLNLADLLATRDYIDLASLKHIKGIVKWESIRETTHKQRAETRVWVSDKSVIEQIPNKLFGLPTTVMLVNPTGYRETEWVAVKVNDLTAEERTSGIMHSILDWLVAVFLPSNHPPEF